jgi:hypothetical protein
MASRAFLAGLMDSEVDSLFFYRCWMRKTTTRTTIKIMITITSRKSVASEILFELDSSGD